MAGSAGARFDGAVLASVPVVPVARMLDAVRLQLPGAAAAAAWVRHGVRFLADHTGLPALVVAAILLAVGYRVLKRTLRFAMEVGVLAAALVAMTAFGWIQW